MIANIKSNKEDVLVVAFINLNLNIDYMPTTLTRQEFLDFFFV